MKYDFVISFAGEDRGYAKELVSELNLLDVNCFYDESETSDLIGKDLYQHLSEVYQNDAKYCVILCSESYIRKKWTRLELRSAQARHFDEPNSDYIIPIMLNDVSIPGIPKTVGYLDANIHSVAKIADILANKVNLDTHPKAISKLIRRPWKIIKNYAAKHTLYSCTILLMVYALPWLSEFYIHNQSAKHVIDIGIGTVIFF